MGMQATDAAAQQQGTTATTVDSSSPTKEMSFEELCEYFAKDQFAAKCLGARVDSYEPGKSVVSMTIDDRHHNAQGFVMGGTIMGLCDFALAVVANANQTPSCSVNHSCDMLRRVRGKRLIATGVCAKEGRSMCFYEINVHDELGTHVARMSATTMRTPYVAPTGN